MIDYMASRAGDRPSPGAHDGDQLRCAQPLDRPARPLVASVGLEINPGHAHLLECVVSCRATPGHGLLGPGPLGGSGR